MRATSIDSDLATQGTTSMVKTYKDATCFALEATAVLKAAASAEPFEKLIGAAALMERISEDMQGVRVGPITAEQRRHWANEIKAIAHVANRMNDPGVDEGPWLDLPLLYAAETLFDLTLARLQAPEEALHG